MADNTTLNPGSGGDVISTEDLGGGLKLCRSKIVVGAHDVDGGDVTASNPFFTTPCGTTSGGGTPKVYISASGTNATSHKGSAGNLYSVSISNNATTARYVKFYDKSTSPTVGTDTPVAILIVPGSTTGAGHDWNPPIPVSFLLGIAFAITGGVANTDTSSINANEVSVTLLTL